MPHRRRMRLGKQPDGFVFETCERPSERRRRGIEPPAQRSITETNPRINAQATLPVGNVHPQIRAQPTVNRLRTPSTAGAISWPASSRPVLATNFSWWSQAPAPPPLPPAGFSRAFPRAHTVPVMIASTRRLDRSSALPRAEPRPSRLSRKEETVRGLTNNGSSWQKPVGRTPPTGRRPGRLDADRVRA